MRVGMDLIEFYPSRMGGVETYARNTLQYLQDGDNQNRYRLSCSLGSNVQSLEKRKG